ncbi:Crp/Fnr family transcriptional regulator [Staphylococcus felis]|uniref:Crp/Fnr family transcriptional regulator n=1 Tax=Staphylococcus felis TaxID=46127 RepID=UPI000E281B84|nr:Crp/Fnr family transcriptional regulator [Staphylococcus felis]REI09743.1 Crp/Fnr family transcriptional regulator [Staphylococcus felis]
MTYHNSTLNQTEFDVAVQTFAHHLNISTSKLNAFKEELTLRAYKRGQVIYYDTLDTTHLKFLVRGLITRESYSDTGESYLWMNREPQLFPIEQLFNATQTHEMCTAFHDCLVLCIPKYLLESLCMKDHHLFIRIYELLTLNMKQHIHHNMILTCKTAKDKVIYLINHICENIGIETDAFYEVPASITIQALGDMAGLSRETVSHIIHDLTTENLVYKDPEHWIISKQLLHSSL